MLIKRLSNRLSAHCQKKSSLKWRSRLLDRRLGDKAAQAAKGSRTSDRVEMVGDIMVDTPMCARTPTLLPKRPLLATRATLQAARANEAPPKKFSPEPLPSRCMQPPPCPTAFPRLPHSAISVSYSVELKPSRHCLSNTMPCPRRLFEEKDSSSFLVEDNISSPKVRFAPQVQIMEIPSHVHYGAQVRDTMWHNSRDIKKSAKRNAFEYWFDGEDWQNCTEEEDMFMWKGKLLHPFTYERLQVAIAKKQQREQEEFHLTPEESQRHPRPFRPMLLPRREESS